ncbi:hypothetical protein WHR41_09553 [Cladosporium halotolerans]|uniref:Metallo-beta-lactamase domain-containing protein n=1 Tax=Cladosporium halotolerans TaxID=1052096 RepID=A0AB34K9H3_9PEZI
MAKNNTMKPLSLFMRSSAQTLRLGSPPLSLSLGASYHYRHSLHISTAIPGVIQPTKRFTAAYCASHPFRHNSIRTFSPLGHTQANTSSTINECLSSHLAEPIVHDFFDKTTGSWQYVVADPAKSAAVIIDPVLDYDPAIGKISTKSADVLFNLVVDKGYKIDMILETHAHADHMTAASYLQQRLSQECGQKPAICIGCRIKQVQEMFGARYNIPAKDYEGVFDKLWEDDETFQIGNLTAQVLHLPGHTPDHVGYKIGNNVFVGDSVFNIDLGSARADFPGGSAEAIFNSGRKLFLLPEDTKIWIGHDYPPEGRDKPVPFMTVKQQKEKNKHLKDGTAKYEFIEMRRTRDETLASPRLLHASLQMNIRAGRLPRPTASGERMLQIPVEAEVSW